MANVRSKEVTRKLYELAGYEMEEAYGGVMLRFTNRYTGHVISHSNLTKAGNWIRNIIRCNPGYFVEAENYLNTLRAQKAA